MNESIIMNSMIANILNHSHSGKKNIIIIIIIILIIINSWLVVDLPVLCLHMLNEIIR